MMGSCSCCRTVVQDNKVRRYKKDNKKNAIDLRYIYKGITKQHTANKRNSVQTLKCIRSYIGTRNDFLSSSVA